jgi:hypothetical protein
MKKPPKTKKIRNVVKMPLQKHEKLHGFKKVHNKPQDPLHHHEHLAGVKIVKQHHNKMPKSNLVVAPLKVKRPSKPRKI